MSNSLTVKQDGTLAPGMFDSIEQMTAALTVAEKVSQSNILPDTFKGKAGDVLIALDMAQRLRMNPLHVMQGIVIVHGRPTFSGQFYASLIKASGEFVKYDYEETEENETVKEIGGRKNCRCRIVAVRPNGEKVAGPWVDYKMAVKDGWATRSGSKWQTMPALMLRYRAAAFFVRTCCPDACMGLRDEFEQDDIPVKAETPQGAMAVEVRAAVEAEVIEEEMVARAEAPIVESESARAVRDYLEAIKVCPSESDLEKIGTTISEDGRLYKYQKNVLRCAFKRRRDELKK